MMPNPGTDIRPPSERGPGESWSVALLRPKGRHQTASRPGWKSFARAGNRWSTSSMASSPTDVSR